MLFLHSVVGAMVLPIHQRRFSFWIPRGTVHLPARDTHRQLLAHRKSSCWYHSALQLHIRYNFAKYLSSVTNYLIGLGIHIRMLWWVHSLKTHGERKAMANSQWRRKTSIDSAFLGCIYAVTTATLPTTKMVLGWGWIYTDRYIAASLNAQTSSIGCCGSLRV